MEDDHKGKSLAVWATKLAAVVLHACETGRGDARASVLSLAQTLIQAGLPAVIAQQANLSYASSQAASEAWYNALTAGEGLAQALFEVRVALAQTEQPDWAVPVLCGGATCLSPLMDVSASTGPADPVLTSQNLTADLPTPTGVFVGRHAQLRALHLMLEQAPGSGASMALITGPGGIGKSTLAAQAAIRYGRKYQAVLTLSCLGYQRLEPFLQRIGETLSQHGHPGFLEQSLSDPKKSTTAKIDEAVAACNRAGPFLFVIDNLESAQKEDRTLRDPDLLLLLHKLLTNLRGGRVFITSRYSVEGLLPQGKFAAHLLRLDLIDLSHYETMQLFARHAPLAQLGEAVRSKLINEFGGFPYVYDLLSSDADSQSLGRLIHDVQMRITQERKQRAKEEWDEIRRQVVEFVALKETTRRLPERSQKLLGQLSVLERPFPLQALEQGLAAARDIWQPLLDWPLLRFDAQVGFYHLHSLTRKHAHGLLDEPARQQTQTQLALWYERYATQESHALDDYLQAHRLFRAVSDFRAAANLVMNIAEPLMRYGWYPLLRDLCQTSLNDVSGGDERLAAKMQLLSGMISQKQGNYEEARHLFQESLSISEHLGDQSGRAAPLRHLGSIAQDQGNYEEARRLYQESLALKERLGNQEGQAASLHDLGIIAQGQGNYEEARRLYQESLSIRERLGDQSGRAASLHGLGSIARLQDNYEEARRLYQESLSILERLGNQDGRASILVQLGILAYEQQNFEQALTYIFQAWKIFQVSDSPSHEIAQGMISRIRSQMDEASFRALWEKVAGHLPLPAFPDEENSTPLQELLAEELSCICLEVVVLLLTGQTERQQAFATHLEQRFADPLFSEETQNFLHLLVAWLRGQEREALEAKLQPPFQELYARTVALVEQEEETEETDQENTLTLADLPDLVSTLLLQATKEDREEYASWLVQTQQQVPAEEVQLRHFFDCLVAVLRGEQPELAGLQAPFTDLWQELQYRLATWAE